jgi:hypothetical protein
MLTAVLTIFVPAIVMTVIEVMYERRKPTRIIHPRPHGWTK